MVRATSTNFLIFGLLACAFAQSDPIEKAPRLRFSDANGVQVLAERVPGASRISIQLFQSSRGLDPGVEISGWRHMLEHLNAKGAKSDIDMRLELVGGFLIASTLRDATRFEIDIPAASLPLGLEILAELLQARTFQRAEIEAEVRVLNQELALVSRDRGPFRSAWAQAYGSTRPDPIGTPLGYSSIAPGTLSLLDRQLKAPSRISIVIAGPGDVDEAIDKVKPLISALESAEISGITQPIPADAPVASRSGFIAAKTKRWADRETWAQFVAAQGLRVLDDRLSVTFTPTVMNGLIVVAGEPMDDWSDMKRRSAELMGTVVADARLLARRWVRGALTGPSNITAFRGYLFCQNSRATPEQAIEQIEALTDDEIANAMGEWISASPGAVIQ